MPLPDYLDKFNPALLTQETFPDFKAAILKEYGNDVSSLEAKVSQAEKGTADQIKNLTDENTSLKAANWDLWKQIPAGETEKKTNNPQPEDTVDEDAPTLESFFAPVTE